MTLWYPHLNPCQSPHKILVTKQKFSSDGICQMFYSSKIAKLFKGSRQKQAQKLVQVDALDLSL